jgi:hypothetical protein
MTWSDLANFFVMHGENQDRLRGRAGRGRFGTGKSAAFGIADVLTITTVRNGKRSKVSLSRDAVREAPGGAPIPLQIVDREVSTNESNGTLVEIEQIHLKRLDQKTIIRYLERHLARWPKNVVVHVNNHECQYVEPIAVHSEVIAPDPQQVLVLGPVALTIKIAAASLDEDQRGIAVFSNGVWHENTLAGCAGKDMANYIFGEVDVPALDLDSSPVAPFDVSRSMRLNPANEIVRVLYAFLGSHIERVRRELVAKERERQRSEEARRLERAADEIARLLNEDFDEYRRQLSKVSAKGKGGTDHGAVGEGGVRGEDLAPGCEVPARVVSERFSALGEDSSADAGPTELIPEFVEDPDGPLRASRSGNTGSGRHRPRGGFGVAFRHEGAENERARYVSDERTITINLDHPQFAAALKTANGIDDPVFKRLAYEVAFTEYAVALAYELSAQQHYLEINDALFEVRDTLDRITRRAAHLYGVSQ